MGIGANEQKNDKETYMQLFKGLIDEISEASEKALLAGGRKLLDDALVEKSLSNKKMLTYVYLSGLLNLLGREINPDNMRKVLKGIGAVPDSNIINAIVNANSENGVIYVYSTYFLAILGRDISVKNIMDLVASLGVTPNREFAQNALNLYNRQYGKK